MIAFCSLPSASMGEKREKIMIPFAICSEENYWETFFFPSSPLMLLGTEREKSEGKKARWSKVSVDFKWNKLNKVLLLITEEWSKSSDSVERWDEARITRSSGENYFSVCILASACSPSFSLLLMEAKMLKSSLNASCSTEEENERRNLWKAQFYHAN